jgi:hypothetical protein
MILTHRYQTLGKLTWLQKPDCKAVKGKKVRESKQDPCQSALADNPRTTDVTKLFEQKSTNRVTLGRLLQHIFV